MFHGSAHSEQSKLPIINRSPLEMPHDWPACLNSLRPSVNTLALFPTAQELIRSIFQCRLSLELLLRGLTTCLRGPSNNGAREKADIMGQEIKAHFCSNSGPIRLLWSSQHLFFISPHCPFQVWLAFFLNQVWERGQTQEIYPQLSQSVKSTSEVVEARGGVVGGTAGRRRSWLSREMSVCGKGRGEEGVSVTFIAKGSGEWAP